MPPFPKPNFTFNFDVLQQIHFLQQHKHHRGIPEKSDDSLLIATWNIANLGLQKRWDDHYEIISEIISWFDLVAIQEVNDKLDGLRSVENYLPDYYDVVFSDKAGNNERYAYAYNSRKISTKELFGEISIPPSSFRHIKLEGVNQPFLGFDRPPFLAAFEWNNFDFVLVNVHNFFGSDKKIEDLNRRSLETYAIARYTDLRRKSKNAYSKNYIALGDFNLPKTEKGDPIYDALTKRGLTLPEYSSKVYSNITDDKQYDQIAFFPGLKSRIKNNGIFDFDDAIFPTLWQDSPSNFKKYLRYYISDHRPMWVEVGKE